MRHLRQVDGSVRQLPDVTHCSGCGVAYRSPDFTTSWVQCSCTPGQRGHLAFICLRGTCRVQTFDPPCTLTEVRNPLEAHAADGNWDSIQHGPTLDVGDG